MNCVINAMGSACRQKGCFTLANLDSVFERFWASITISQTSVNHHLVRQRFPTNKLLRIEAGVGQSHIKAVLTSHGLKMAGKAVIQDKNISIGSSGT